MSRKNQLRVGGYRRRAVVAVQVATMCVAIIAFAALSVDVSVMYNAKGELQRTADSAAMAAASRLATDNKTEARNAAREYTEANDVLGLSVTLAEDGGDVQFYRAVLTGSGSYEFHTDGAANAVKVTVRTASSQEGALPLYFAAVFGRHSTNLAASATAMLIPRDIAIVADLSASHNDDSELRHLHLAQTNLFDVWAAIPPGAGKGGILNGADPPPPGEPTGADDQPGTGSGGPSTDGGDPYVGGSGSGPRWGWMTGWGEEIVFDENATGPIPDVDGASVYDPSSDDGLAYIRKGYDTTDPDIIQNLIEAGYTAQERAVILSGANDSTFEWYVAGQDEAGSDIWKKDYSVGKTHWRSRAKVMLGLAGWESGMVDEYGNPDAKYSGMPGDPGDSRYVLLDAYELAQTVAYPFAGGSWDNYIDYMQSNSAMTREWSASYPDRFGDSGLKRRYGIKTFMNYMLEKQPRHAETDLLANTPHQPMQSVKDAVGHLVDTVHELDSEDQLSLEIYDTRGRHKVDLRDRDGDYYEVSSVLSAMQAGHHEVWTNMGAGILRAREELSSVRARPSARKVMILLTDGYANVSSEYGNGGDYSGGPVYARNEAALAAGEGIQIYAVSVGAFADTDLMDEIAETGGGEHFHADGSIEEYSSDLDEIFRHLGGARPVALVE
ncbi:MAG: VWA domain-containing protein [bacterium]|nr:VWA domain-containing protein [bacterium]